MNQLQRFWMSRKIEATIEKHMDVNYRTPICGTPLLTPHQIVELLEKMKKTKGCHICQ
jgi:hypothetical protein